METFWGLSFLLQVEFNFLKNCFNKMKLFDIQTFRKKSTSIIIGHKYSGKSELCKYFLRNLHFISGSILTKNKSTYNEIQTCNFISVLEKIPEEGFFILDNSFDEDWISNPIIKKIFLHGGDLNLTTFLSMVHPYHIHPVLRYNIDYAFLLKTHNHATRKRLFEMYGGIFSTYNCFNDYMDKLEDYECLVIDLQSFKPLEESVFLLRHNL